MLQSHAVADEDEVSALVRKYAFEDTLEALRAEEIDANELGARSMSYARIDQLAIEHMLGAR